MARVDQVLYGNYAIQGSRIAVTIFLLDLHSQQVLRTEKASGSLADLRNLVDNLTKRFLKNRGRPLTRQELERLAFRPTDSVAATERFYRALDHYDHGRYADALAEFLLARKQDPNYLDAALWSGRIYEFLRPPWEIRIRRIPICGRPRAPMEKHGPA